MNGVIKIINHKIFRWLGCIDWWTYWNSKTWNKKKQEGGFLGDFVAFSVTSIVEWIISSVAKGISRRGVRRTGRGYMNKIF